MGGSSDKPKYDRFYEKKPFSAGVHSGDIFVTCSRAENWFGGFVSDKIKDVSHGIVNHAGIVGKDGDIIEALFEGVRVNKMTKYVDDKTGVLIFRNKDLSEDWIGDILAFAYIQAKNKTPYDFMGVLKFVLPFMSNQKDMFFCSELVRASFMVRKVRVADVITESTTPQDLVDFQYNIGAFQEYPQHGWYLADWQNMNISEVVKFQDEKWGK